ncbi:MAG: demethoxyubiquinone hydroxylase family protein [Anaerolineae bacterium]|nr:demethoxyubiquinone hydroxylase family protein [Anaerolineae bacterium]
MPTDPFTGLVPRKMTASELARAIRLDIQAELDAANLYQAHIDATDDERARAILAHIRDEEKEHAAEFVELLKLLDPDQATYLDEAPGDVAQIIREARGAAAGQGAGGPEGRLTVGSLLGRPQGEMEEGYA